MMAGFQKNGARLVALLRSQQARRKIGVSCFPIRIQVQRLTVDRDRFFVVSQVGIDGSQIVQDTWSSRVILQFLLKKPLCFLQVPCSENVVPRLNNQSL